MNRLLIYISVLFVLFMGLTLPHLFVPHHGLLFVVEEVVGVFLLIIGCVLFSKLVRRIMRYLEENDAWKNHWKKRLLKESTFVIGFGLSLGLLIGGPVQLYVENYGLPQAYQEIIDKKNLIDAQAGLAHHPPGRRGGHPPHLKGTRKPNLFLPILSGSFFLSILLFGTEELFGLNERRASDKIKKQKLLKEQALMKASVLQKQLNPHFMFNALNVLSGLIHEDVQKSEQFIKELSEIYRYTLVQSEEVLSTLKSEQKFINSYLYLLEIRFEDKLNWKIDIPEDKLDCRIPSMTFELLVENAVKHNVVDKESPLFIEVFVKNDFLIVKNNLQRREGNIISHGLGLSNLKERLQLLGLNGANFISTEKEYIASVPLLCD